MAERLTFPQSGDEDDAEHFASMIGQDNLAGFVEEGLDFTVNYTVPEVEVTTGKGYIQTASSTASSSGDTVLKTNHVIQVPAQTVSLADSATNYVYLQPDLSTDDNGTVAAFTSTQPGDALLIGVIDTTADTTELRNREPAGAFRQLRLDDDKQFIFGSDDDYFVEYDSVNDKLSIGDAVGNDLVDFNDNLTRFFNDLDLENNALTDVSAINGNGDKINIDDDIDVTDVTIVYGNNPGVQKLVDMPVDSASAAGTEHSYDLALDNTALLRVSAESDGAGGIQNQRVNIVNGPLDVSGSQIVNVSNIGASGSEVTFSDIIDLGNNDLVDDATLIYDASNNYIVQTALENDSITVTAGDGLKNGGLVALGGTTTLDIEPADFAGTFLSDDGSDNLQVDIGTGVENDGTGNIRVDEDYDFTFTSQIGFSAGLATSAAINMNSNQVQNLPAPSANNDAARKSYVDSVAQGLEVKDSVDVATNGTNVDLTSTTDPNPIDGYTFSNGEYVLLKDQTTASENGIYVANTATDPTTWTRRADMDEDTDAIAGAFTFVEKGTGNGNTAWTVTTDDPITLGTTSITWAQFAAAGEITAGDGLTKTGQTLDIFVSDFAGDGLKAVTGDLAIEPANFAGTFLSDDGADNLTVDIGRGLENDGSGNIRFDEDTAYTFTSTITGSAALAADFSAGDRMMLPNRTTDPAANPGDMWYRNDLD